MYSNMESERQTQMQTNTVRRETRDKTHGEFGGKKSNLFFFVLKTGRRFSRYRLTHIGSITTVIVSYACCRTKNGALLVFSFVSVKNSVSVLSTYRTLDKPYKENGKSCATAFQILCWWENAIVLDTGSTQISLSNTTAYYVLLMDHTLGFLSRPRSLSVSQLALVRWWVQTWKKMKRK